MVIRPINPEEKIMKSKIQSIAFMYSQDFSKEDPEEFAKGYETGRAAFDENGKMCSCLELIPFIVQFDGKSVPMGGIGGVASLPEEREKKYIRHIFEFIMDEMYENGAVFSYLYPFSHAYYRKFGYELNMRLRTYHIPLTALKGFDQSGTLRLFTPDMDRSPIRNLYNQFIKDKNLAVCRTEKLWDRFFEKDPYKDKVYLYVWFNAQDEPGGYIQFRPEKPSEGSNILHVQEFVWCDYSSFNGILSFMAGLSAQAERMIWRAPDFVDLLPLFKEPYEIKQEIHTFGMNRIVNVVKALETLNTPEGSGELIVGVKDDFFGRNTGNYRLSWENGLSEVTRATKSPDMVCDIQTLTQLVTGFTTPEVLIGAGRLDVTEKGDIVKKLFTPKKLYINNYF